MAEPYPRLSRAEREQLPVLLAASRAQPWPKDYRPFGCLTALLALAALAVLPRVMEGLGARFLSGPPLLVPLVLMLLTGVFLAFAGRSLIVSARQRRIEEALATLLREHPAGSREAALRAAVELLDLGHVKDARTTVRAFDADEMRERLGAAMPLVTSVERELVRGERIPPVFSGAPSGSRRDGGRGR